MPGTRTRLTLTADTRKLLETRAALQAMAVRARDVSPAWHALLDWFVAAEREQFASGGHRFGSGWAPLAAYTIAEKVRHGYPTDPLIRSGDLAASLTRRPMAVEHVTPHEVVAGTDDPKAIYHQRGTSRMPQRKLFDPRQIRRERAATTAVANWIVKGEQRVGGRRVLRQE